MSLTQTEVDAILVRIENGESLKDAIEAEGHPPSEIGWFRSNHGSTLQNTTKLARLKSRPTAGLDQVISRLEQKEARKLADAAEVTDLLTKLRAEKASR